METRKCKMDTKDSRKCNRGRLKKTQLCANMLWQKSETLKQALVKITLIPADTKPVSLMLKQTCKCQPKANLNKQMFFKETWHNKNQSRPRFISNWPFLFTIISTLWSWFLPWCWLNTTSSAVDNIQYQSHIETQIWDRTGVKGYLIQSHETEHNLDLSQLRSQVKPLIVGPQNQVDLWKLVWSPLFSQRITNKSELVFCLCFLDFYLFVIC